MSQSKARIVIRTRRWAEKLLLVGGLTGIAIWASSYLGAALFQSWQSYVFECRLRGSTPTFVSYVVDRGKRLVAAEEAWCGIEPAPSAPPPVSRAVNLAPAAHPLLSDGLVGRLVIPRLGLRAVVREGASERTLSFALGHIPGTALPGQQGNVGVAGHRDTLFHSLHSIEKNDRIQFQTLTGNYDYQVESIQIVKPADVAVLAPGPYLELTLVTCYPFYYVGAAPDRFIVKARQVSP
jgi:sortase A